MILVLLLHRLFVCIGGIRQKNLAGTVFNDIAAKMGNGRRDGQWVFMGGVKTVSGRATDYLSPFGNLV
jgi:hypothetical protein